MLELSLEKILSKAKLDRRFAPLPKYPAISRDISAVLGEDISVADVTVSLQQTGRPLLQSVRITDYYKGKQIPAGYRG